jgi:spore coat protein U-like protein
MRVEHAYPLDAGTYTVALSNAAGMAVSGPFRLRVTQGSDLVGYWPLDEAAGALAWDESGLENHATVVSGTRQAGRIGGAVRFDGRAA